MGSITPRNFAGHGVPCPYGDILRRWQMGGNKPSIRTQVNAAKRWQDAGATRQRRTPTEAISAHRRVPHEKHSPLENWARARSVSIARCVAVI
jgi:hypothetical protein